jgi:hypothetical protein
MFTLISVAAWAATVGAVPQSAPVPQDAVPFARAFLQAFADDPQSTRKLVTSDALFVFIDMGGPYAELLKGLGAKKPAIAACELESLRETATPTMEELKNTPARSFSTPGHFASVEGVYACKQPNGSRAFVDVTMILKDNLVAEFGMIPRRS